MYLKIFNFVFPSIL